MRLRPIADGQPAGHAAAPAGPPAPQRTGPPTTDPQRTSLDRTAPRKADRRGMSPGAVARRHWMLAVLLTAGLVMRILAQIAYRPALLYIDSIKYLYVANGNDPVGYRVLLTPLLAVGNLDLVAAVQHLLGLAMAVALYLLMRRRGVPRWLAALATAPILLDGYQLQNEQTIMPDTLFEALIVAGLVLLLWRPKPKTWMIIGAGLALGASATVAQIGEILILPALIYLLAAIPGGRAKLIQSIALCAAFALPIAFYCSVSLVQNGHFRLASTGTNDLYGRLVLATNCKALSLPAYERALCPTHQQALALGIDALEHDRTSPLRLYVAPAGMAGSSVVSNFDRRLEMQDPVGIGLAIGKDAAKLFAGRRVQDAGDTPISRWQFQDHYPQYPPYISIKNGQLQMAQQPTGVVQLLGRGQPFGGGNPLVVKPLASFLRAYQLDGGYTPGPLLLLATVAGLLGSLAVVRRRATAAQRATATACLLVFAAGAAVLLGSDVFQFSWRYQLPALITLPPAGALGLTVIGGYLASRHRRPARPHPPRRSPSAGEAGEGPTGGRPASGDADGQNEPLGVLRTVGGHAVISGRGAVRTKRRTGNRRRTS